MRGFFGIVLVVLPILSFLFALAVAPMGGAPQAGSLTLFSLCAFGAPVTLGAYLLKGGSSMDKARHLKFGVAILLLLILAAGMAMSSPADFDLDVVWKFLLIFGGLAFGILGLGYLHAPKKPVVDQIDALEERRHDDRLR